MKCSNCGKDVPFAGNVCAYCGADKKGDQLVQTVAILVAVVVMLVAFFIWGVLGALGGLVVGAIGGVILGNIAKANI